MCKERQIHQISNLLKLYKCKLIIHHIHTQMKTIITCIYTEEDRKKNISLIRGQYHATWGVMG